MSPSAGRWRRPCSWDGCSASLKRRCLEAACHRHYRRSVESLLCSFLRCGVMCIFRGDLESETQGGGMTPLWWPLPLMSVRCAAACPPCGGVWGERRHLGRGKVKRFMACPQLEMAHECQFYWNFVKCQRGGKWRCPHCQPENCHDDLYTKWPTQCVRLPTHTPTHCRIPQPSHSFTPSPCVFTNSHLLLQSTPSGPPSSPTQSLIHAEVCRVGRPLLLPERGQTVRGQ